MGPGHPAKVCIGHGDIAAFELQATQLAQSLCDGRLAWTEFIFLFDYLALEAGNSRHRTAVTAMDPPAASSDIEGDRTPFFPNMIEARQLG